MAISIIVKPDAPDFYADTQWERKPHGTIEIDGKAVAHTCQCCHCGGHFISRKGSGMRRSWCTKCNAVTCGREGCVKECVHWRKKIAEFERKASIRKGKQWV